MSEQNTPCPCANWARSINLKYLTNHHPNCPRYNDSLMDVWKVSDGSASYYQDNEADAFRDMAADEECGVTDLKLTQERMHREVFEHLPEFNGF